MTGEIRYVTWSGGPTGDYICDNTNDQTAINNALSWANANPGNIIVMKGPHKYSIRNQIFVGSSTTWTAESGVILEVPDGACGTSPDDCVFPDGKPVITQIPGTIPSGIEIYGFKIDGNLENQSTQLGYARGVLQSRGSGVERLIGFYGSSTGRKINDVNIYNMEFVDAFGEALLVVWGENIRFRNNHCENLQHEAVYYKAVAGSGNSIHHNTIEAITSDGIRLDSCQNTDIYDNDIDSYDGQNTNGAPKHGEQGIQIANNSAYSILTNNIKIYNNTITGPNLGGIWLNDVKKTAGTDNQIVHIYNNKLVNCGYSGWAAWASGIGIQWGNGLVIENNTLEDCWCDGILVYGNITSSSTSIDIRNNNIINTHGLRAGASNSNTVLGYGIANKVSTYITVNAENNYLANNVSGDYYGVIPISVSLTPITDSIPGSGTTDDDIPDPGAGGIYIPATVSIVDDEYEYVERAEDDFSAYLNHIPIDVVSYNGLGGKVIGESKSPNVDGNNLNDFGFEGSELNWTCVSSDPDELYKIMASFYNKGSSTIELGGPHKGYKITGMGRVHRSSYNKAFGDVPEELYYYNLNFKAEKPFMERLKKKVRGRYVYNTTQFSSDDIYSGNLVKNPSFEDWTPNNSLIWSLQDTPEDNEYRCVRYAPEIEQFCAVAVRYVNKIMISDGQTWRLPTGLNCSNKDNLFRGLVWCPDWTTWIATSISGQLGYAAMKSSNGDDWEAVATPAGADNHSWGCGIWIPPFEGISPDLFNGRAIFFAYSGTNRIMYTDDAGASWIQLTDLGTTINSTAWLSADYSKEQRRIVAVAYSNINGQNIIHSDDFGDTWTLQTSPLSGPDAKLTSVRWIDTWGLWVISAENDGKAATELPTQIMISETGLPGSWTLVQTPYAKTTTTGGGELIQKKSESSPDGYNYTTLSESYLLQYSFTLPAPQDVGVYRIENVSCQLRTLGAATAYCKATVSSASLGTDVLLKEWIETATDYTTKTQSLAKESAPGEEITIKFWIKTSSKSVKAGATKFGYSVSEISSSGSIIEYTRISLRELVWAKEIGVLAVVAQDTTDNKVLWTTNGTNWIMGDSAGNQGWVSACFADDKNQFMAVSTTGSGKRAMTSTGYGTFENIAPISWTRETKGQSRSDIFAVDGRYSFEIKGDGITEQPGRISQKLPFDYLYNSGIMFILSGRGRVTGLTSGKFIVDIYAGGTVVKELIWDSDTEYIRKEIKFKFDTVPSNIYIRIRGADTPNAGSQFNFDDVIISKVSDFELGKSGADIYTSGYCDVIPTVTVRGVSTSSSSPSTSRTYQNITDQETVFESVLTKYETPVWVAELPALAGDSCHKIDSLFFKIKSSSVSAYTYIRVTVQAGSLFGGQERDIALWTTNKTDFQSYTYNLPYILQGGPGEKVTIRYYIRTSKTPYRAFAYELGYTRTEVLDPVYVGNNEIYLYNVRDPRRILKVCNVLPQGHIIQIKNNYTGSHRYVEMFEDDSYTQNAYSITDTVARNETNHSLVMNPGDSWIFPIDTLYPVVGIPFIKLYVVSGIPQISIADDSGANGSPGTFYPVDSNTSTPVENAEVNRELDNRINLHLRGGTKYYIKIEPLAGQSCEFGQLMEYASLDTMDAQRFYIYSGGKANTIAAQIEGTGKCSAVVSLDYHDAQILP